MRGAIGVQQRLPQLWPRYLDAVFDAMWVRPRDLGQAGEIAAVLAPLGITAEDFMALVSDPAIKAALVASTEEAVARGVFGAPTCFVGEAMFFGQDRLDFVREALAATP